MTRFFKGLGIALGVAVAALAIVTLLFHSPLMDTPIGQVLSGGAESAKAAAANAALDASGVKTQLDAALRERASQIASATGLSENQVDGVIDQLDIESWSVATLPTGATATGSYETTYKGVAATVTTYDDPGYVTVNAAGQDVTLAVPESAQSSLSYLSYLK